MKGKASRQSHKATNTFVFRGFGEKVRALRISARKYLLQRPQNTEGESTTFTYEAISKARELNVTQDFKTFLRELGNEVRTTRQLVLLESHVVSCISTHISLPETSALQPLCDILVAFANDLPQEFYNNHFYNILPKLIAHLSTKDPEVIESIFLCIVSLFVVLQKYLYDDFYTLYHVHNFCHLLSKSYPWYINELAAQSLGVLVRKIPKKNQFISVSLKKLKKDESQIQGLGRVFASMMKSDVIHRLHSCTPKILSKLLEALSGSDEVPQEPALETVKFAMSLVAKYITTYTDTGVPWQSLWNEDNALVWPTFWDCIKRLISMNDADTHHHLNSVLQVLNVFISHKQGALITDVNDSVANCVIVLESSLPDTVGYTMTEILATLLTIPENRLSHSDFKRIIASFLSCNYSPAVKFSFVKQILELERFDEEILPLLLPCLDCMLGENEDPDLSKNIVELVADITVQKRPPCATGLELNTWSPYPLNFTLLDSNERTHIGQYIEREIKKGFSEDLSNLEDLSLCLLCLPHIMHVNYHELTPYLSKILGNAMAMLKDEAQKVVDTVKPLSKKKKSEVPIPEFSLDMNIKSDIPLVARQVLFLISLVIEVMSHTLSKENFLASLRQLKLIELLKKRHHYRENVHILRAVDIHFTVASSENQTDVISEEYMREIYEFLAPALASSNPQVRFLILHIFSLFPMNLIPPENGDDIESVFQILLKAESVPITPWEFRDRLRFITMVDADHLKPHIPVSGEYNEAPLLFLIGQLYTNYKDLWDPILKTISGFANSIPQDVFWPLWFSKLKIASHTTREVLLRKPVDPEQDLQLSSSVIYDVNCKLTLHSGYSKLQPKPNHLNFRDLLWRAMNKFPDICENKNRDLVPLFFNFLEKEFFPVDFTVAPTQDITLEQRQQEIMNEGDESQQAEETKEIGKQLEELEGDEDTAEYPRRASVKSLCEQLALFSKFHNPRMLTQSKKLESMYLELLTHPSPALQKLSFDCLLGYNHSFLTPYKDHMSKLLEDKTFKNSLTLFSIDGSEKTLDDEHRNDFMPYLMRVLYGKMHFKTGSNSAGKGRTNVRKAVILRFLAGASEEEFQTFLDLAFDVILGHIDGTALDIVNQSREGLDLKNVVPLNRLQGALTTMENIIERIANRMTMKRSLLFKVIIYIANLSSLILERRSEIKKRHVSFLKHIRQQAQKQIVNYFTLLEDYKWQMEEIDAVFETMVWPNLRRLPDEGLISPVPLLNLFECWAEIPRYFPLLAKVHKEDITLTPLTYIVKLVSTEKCSDKVRTVVFNMVEKLLTLQDHEESTLNEKGEALPLVVCSPVVEVKRLISRDGLTQQNYGSALLVPHLSGLLQSMKILITNLSKGIKVTQRDLTILSSLTEWVTDKNISEELLTLIIPLIVNKHVKKAEIVAQLLTTCSYLLPVIDNSKQFLRPLISQFGCLVDRASRDALCKTIAAIASVNSECQEIADLAANLNSWNPKFVDVLDYDRRLDGYRQLSDYCKSCENISIDYCQFLVFNCMYVIIHIQDTSLRDMSRLCLDQFIDMCVRLEPSQPSEVKQVLIDRLLSLVRNGLRNPKDEVRNDIFFVLQKIVHKCHSLYDKLEDLHKIADEVDEDADFFSNMMHIQRHRRSRAMMRLSDKLKNGSVVLSVETITEYLLPALKVYLFNDTYAKDDHLVQAAIRCIGAFALLLPWHSYMRMLKAYLNMFKKIDLKYLKVLVKILEFMIDGFHEEVEEVVILEKESKNLKGNTEGAGSGDKLVLEEAASIKSENSIAKSAKKMVGKEGYEKVIEGKTEIKECEHADLPLMADGDLLTRPQKIYLALVNNIIPQLKKTLVGRTRSDAKHKVNKSKYPEDDDIKRIPLAFALIKLMKKLPPKVLDSNVNSILMKMMTFLKSQSQAIRDEARNMLVKIMTELGGKYLPYLVSDLRSILTRGFQTHVLVFTLHSVLSQIRPLLRGSDIDSCLIDMIEICKEDILGLQAEEKKVAKITTKVKEARNDKSYAILNFTAEFVSAQALAELLIPLKEVLASTQDRKIVNKIIKCMDDVASGIEKNENITLTQKSVFVYGILNEKLGLLTGNSKKTRSEGKVEKIQVPDCYLLEPDPKKARLIPKTTFETTSFVFIEFALKLLASLLRREKFNPQDEEHHKLLDPYLGVMGKCLKSEHPDISMHSLKCITLLVKYPLPSLKKQLVDVSSEMFVILHKFSSSELAKGKVYELLQLTFRTLAFIIKNVQSYTLTSEQVRVLLQYVQESLNDSSHQTVVFAVLQAVLAKKIDAPELHELMEAVKKMSILCTRQYALNQARVTYYSYLLTYPMKKKKIISEILYYLGNVAYLMEDGRLSAQMFINGVITNFPVKIFTKELETNFWLKISEQIVKEQCKENRTLLHKSLKTLFDRSERKSYLIELCLKLLGDDDESIESCAVAIQLSCKSLSAFLDVSIKKLPKTMITEVTPKIVSLLNPSKFSAQMKGPSLQDDGLCNGSSVSQLQEVDNALVLLMEVLTKLGSLYLTSSEWSEHVDDSMWLNIQSLLFYPHIQIRLSSASLIGQLLAAYPVEGIKVPVVCSSIDKARSLVLDLCEVLQTQAETEVAAMMQLSLAVVRNLIYLIRNSGRVSLIKPKVIDEYANEVNFENSIKETQDAGENIEENIDDPLVLSALWVIRHVGDIAYKELMQSGKDYTVVREALLNLIAGVIVVVGEKLVSPNLLSYIIKHLARELSDDRLSEKLANCTQEVANLVKDHIGVELYTRYFTAAQVSLSKKRLERKAHEQQQRLVDPQRFNKKRKKKRLARAVSKKIALAEKKGKVMSKSKIAKLRASAFATE